MLQTFIHYKEKVYSWLNEPVLLQALILQEAYWAPAPRSCLSTENVYTGVARNLTWAVKRFAVRAMLIFNNNQKIHQKRI